MTRLLLGAVALTVGAGGLLAAGPSPVGEPPDMEKGKTVRYYVWCDKDAATWHVRTTTAGVAPKFDGVRTFTGTVRVKGGVIKGVNADRLEKKGATKDTWEVKDAGRELLFELKTGTAFDTLDFTLDAGVREVEFDLKVDGVARRKDIIFVGKKGERVELGKFTLRPPGR